MLSFDIQVQKNTHFQEALVFHQIVQQGCFYLHSLLHGALLTEFTAFHTLMLKALREGGNTKLF